MFVQNKCLVLRCRNNALSSFDENGNLTDDKNYCLDHSPNPGKAKEQIYEYISTHDIIVGLNACGLIFSDIDLSNKKFFGCNFHHCTFTHINSTNILLKMCIFDFSIFNDCNLIKNRTVYTSFAGCTFSHTLFTSSDMIQNNFNGTKAIQSSFDDSDLFSSRFVKASLIDTSFRNCNLKKTIFYDSYRSNVSFKMSNTREALFSTEGSQISLGTTTNNESFSNSDPSEKKNGSVL